MTDQSSPTLGQRTTRRGRQAAARRDQMLDAALALFAERGVERTTVKDLAAAVGVAPGLLYHYFRSKEELLFAVLERYSFLPELRRLLAVSPDRPATSVLPEMADRFAALIAERRHLLRIVGREVQTDPHMAAALRRLVDEATGLLGGYLDARIAAGELRRHDPRAAARAFFAVVAAHCLTDAPREELRSSVVDILLHGIARTDAASFRDGGEEEPRR